MATIEQRIKLKANKIRKKNEIQTLYFLVY
jgi:hypothetical protein